MSQTIEQLAEQFFDEIGSHCDILHDAILNVWLSVEEQFGDQGYSVEMPEEIQRLCNTLQDHAAVHFGPAEMLTQLNAEVSDDD